MRFGWNVDTAGLVSSPIGDFGVSGVKPLGSTARDLCLYMIQQFHFVMIRFFNSYRALLYYSYFYRMIIYCYIYNCTIELQ